MHLMEIYTELDVNSASHLLLDHFIIKGGNFEICTLVIFMRVKMDGDFLMMNPLGEGAK